MLRLLLGIAIVLLLAGCGGGSSGGDGLSDSEREALADLEEDLARGPDPGPSIEPQPRPSFTAGWNTDFDKAAVPLSEFQSGGPGKDGIPSIDVPRFVPVAEADFLEPKEPVIELEIDGDVRAYPLQILIWHEIVNDEVGGVPVAVTFCPLCNTSIVFDRRVNGATLDFGITGNLRNSDLVMYDRQTESWWQQFGGRALVGKLTGAKLEQLPARIVGFGEFAREHPDGKVLSRETGFNRSYGNNPYSGYDDVDSSPFFPVENSDDDRLPPKERVVFLERGDDAVAIPYSALRDRREIRFQLDGRPLIARWRPGIGSPLGSTDVGAAEVRDGSELVPFDEPFWFAVAAFAPDARIIR